MGESDFDRRESASFYFQGKFFDTEKEFWEYVQEFSNRTTTEEDFDRLFNTLKKDIFINLSIYNREIKNSELRNLLEEIFVFTIEKILEKTRKDNVLP